MEQKYSNAKVKFVDWPNLLRPKEQWLAEKGKYKFMSPEQKKEFHVISHTHWDREWYQCFEVFRLRLVDLIDNLLAIYEEHPEFVFHLDAQTVCLEDYLEIRPHQRSRLCELIAAQRLLAGPWYVQNDFYLSSGESTVRNLLIGSAIADRFGHCDWIGYAPDQFGLIGQLPQIFRQFGIGVAVFGRGNSAYGKNTDGEYVRLEQPAEFEWEADDGSVVDAVYLPNWYNNAQRFSEEPDRAQRYLEHIAERLEPFSSTPYRLLMNGVDHLEAQEDLLPILARLQEGLGSEVSIFQSTLSAYARKAFDYLEGKPKHRVKGELRSGRDLEILQGTLSSRRYLKILNTRCQVLLDLELEPLFSGLAQRTAGRVAYPADMLRYLRKELLKNHAHDSICGCSTDRVHQDNENRFLRILDAAEDLKQRGLKALLNRTSRTKVKDGEFLMAIVNPLPFARSETVTMNVKLPIKNHIHGFRIVDPEDREIDYEIVQSVRQNRMTVSPINLPGQIAVEEITVRFFAEAVPPSGFAIYRLVPAENRPEQSMVVQGTPNIIENDFLSVSIAKSGKVSLQCRESGQTIENIFSFEDVADKGDSYCFFPDSASGALDLSSVRPEITLLEKTDLRQSIRLDYAFELPAEFEASKKCRSSATASNRLWLELSLTKGSPFLDLNGSMDNASKDHRFRLLVHTEVDTDRNTSSQPFDCVERLRIPEQPDLKVDWTHPNNGWVSVQGGDGRFSVLTDGVYDYEHLSDRQHSLAFTWVRSTGRITNDPFGLPSNGVRPTPEWATPENQCLRSIPFHIALRPGKASPAELMKEWQCWVSPLLTGFDASDPRQFMNGRPCLQDADLSENFFRALPSDEVCLPLRSSGPELQGEVAFSAYKQTEDQSGYALRIFNPASGQETISLVGARHFMEMTLAEVPVEGGAAVEGMYKQEIPAKRIATIKVEC